MQQWHDPFQLGNLALLFFWYVGIAFSIYFVMQGARLGAFAAGVVGWITLAFWLIEARSLVTTIQPTIVLTPIAFWLNASGIATVCVEIAASHNLFHKLGMASK
jgi:hypothetical protein